MVVCLVACLKKQGVNFVTSMCFLTFVLNTVTYDIK